MSEFTIKETLVYPVRQKAYCVCGGELVYTGRTNPMNPVKYIHTCDKCDKLVKINGKAYPRIKYKNTVKL